MSREQEKARLVELLKDFDKPNEDEWDEEELELYRDEQAVKELEAIFILSNLTLSDEWQGNQLATAAILKATFALAEQSKKEKRKRRPKCPNGYNCGDCIHPDDSWNGLKFKGFVCGINAK